MPQPIRILLIEDDIADAEYIAEILSEDCSRSFKLDHVPNLQEAMGQARNGKYDIVLADLSLPDSSGINTFSALKKCMENLPILVLTGLDDEDTAFEALRQGAQDYLVKGEISGPFLMKAIQYALERNKIRRELELAKDQLSQANQQLDVLAHYDSLTGLLNRRGLEEILSREMAWAHRHGSNIMVLIIDLDDFKKINDTIGHSAGDGVLKELAHRIQKPLRSTDFAARIGGDEFLILLPDTDSAEGLKIAEKIRNSIFEKTFDVSSRNIKVSASVGVIPIFDPSMTIDDILAETHNALYNSKKEGKNRVSFEEKRKKLERPDRLKKTLEQFLAENQFHGIKQPIFDLFKNTVVGYEVLARASFPSMENPRDFLRLSHENNATTQLDQKCLSACLLASKEIPMTLRRHINISPLTIVEWGPTVLLDLFQKDNIGEVYCLEINHHEIIGDPSYLLQPIQFLKEAGILIAIENASFGQNVFEPVILLKPDFLKIDKRQVNGISHSQARLRTLRRFQKMADSLQTEIIAVGIESREDLDALKSLGIKYGQGFLWGQPSSLAYLDIAKPN